MPQNNKLLAVTLSLGLMLGACNLLSDGVPGVVSVDPADGATDVALNTTIQAKLDLPSGAINVTTLTKTSVRLTDAVGTDVAVVRELSESGTTLIVTPETALAPNSTYQFTVSPELQTTGGTALAAFDSSFTTGTETEAPPSDSHLIPDRSPVVFTAGGATSSDTRSLTLINTSDVAIDVSSLEISGEDAAQFTLADSSAFSLEPGASSSLELGFAPEGFGPQFATLTIESSDSLKPTLEIPLGGLGVEGQGGNLEPSLQWILDTYGFPIDTGDEDPSTTPLVDGPTNSLLGDEVAAQTFTKAAAEEDVIIEVLATFGVENNPVLEFGTYPAGSPDSRKPLFEIQQTPALNAQRLAPEVDAQTDTSGRVVFDPGTAPFGFYSFWPSNRFFDQRYVYTEDRLNTFPDAIPHQVRAYPLVNPDGSAEPNAYVLATEEFTQGFDYNDVVVVIRNVVPGAQPGGPGNPAIPDGIGTLEIGNVLGLPYRDRLLLHHVQDTSGNLCSVDANCNPDPWAEIEIRDTGTIALQNQGGDPLQLSLSVADPNLFVLPNGETSLTLAPDEAYDLEVQFAPVGLAEKGVYATSLTVEAGGESASLELVGLFMLKPEGSREVYLEDLVAQAFGYQTDMGANSQGGLTSAAPDSPLAGEEVRSNYWEAANPGSPVSATQIAAFHSCCTAPGDVFELYEEGSSTPFARMQQASVNSNTIYPRQEGSDEVAQISANVNTTFEIRVAGYSTDPSKGRGNGNLGVRMWPMRDRSGQLVADTYIIAQDYVENGCGTTDRANCDFNDNMYIIENVTPAD